MRKITIAKQKKKKKTLRLENVTQLKTTFKEMVLEHFHFYLRAYAIHYR